MTTISVGNLCLQDLTRLYEDLASGNLFWLDSFSKGSSGMAKLKARQNLFCHDSWEILGILQVFDESRWLLYLQVLTISVFICLVKIRSVGRQILRPLQVGNIHE